MSHYFKYPRTPHLPWSQSIAGDDLRAMDATQFKGKHVVITEKMDGENTSIYRDKIHARSLDSRHHESRNWVKRWHAVIAHEIPVGWRICGENVFAQHSVVYDDLESYFYGFSVWNDANLCLSWEDTLEWFALLGIIAPPVLYNGVWDAKCVRELRVDTEKVEGYVVRLQDAFHFDDFGDSVAKWVRRNHVQTDEHWMHSEIIPNTLKNAGVENEEE